MTNRQKYYKQEAEDAAESKKYHKQFSSTDTSLKSKREMVLETSIREKDSTAQANGRLSHQYRQGHCQKE